MSEKDKRIGDVGETKPERVKRESKQSLKTQRGTRRDLVLMACVLIAFLGVTVWQSSNYREDLQDAITENCQTDRKFRLQYKERGVAEKKLLRLEAESNDNLARLLTLSLAHPDPGETSPSAQIGFTRNARDAFRATAAQEKELARLIVILPVQRCGDEAEPSGGGSGDLLPDLPGPLPTFSPR